MKDPKSKASLIAMGHAWLSLAELTNNAHASREAVTGSDTEQTEK
jgi:hypothetical protein